MNRAKYYGDMKKTLEEGLKTLQELDRAKADLEVGMRSGKYSAEYIKDTIIPKLDSVKSSLRYQHEDIDRKMRLIRDTEYENLKREDALNPADITEDAKLFNIGVTLGVREVQDIIDRNRDNRTMLQLCYRYASDHGIKETELKSRYVSAEVEKTNVGVVYNAVSTILRYHDRADSCERMMRQLMGEGSQIANWAGVPDVVPDVEGGNEE